MPFLMLLKETFVAITVFSQHLTAEFTFKKITRKRPLFSVFTTQID